MPLIRRKKEQQNDEDRERLPTKELGTLIIRAFKLMWTVHPVLFCSMLILFIIVSLLPLATSYLNSYVLDGIINFLSTPDVVATNLSFLLFLYVVSILVSDVFHSIDAIADINFREKAARYLDELITRKISLLDISYFENSETNDLIEKAKSNLNRPLQFMRTAISFTGELIFLVTSLIILLKLNVFIAVILVLTSLPAALSNILYSGKVWKLISDYTEKRRDYYATRSNVIREAQLKEVRIFGLREHLIKDAYAKYDFYWKRWLQLTNRRRMQALVLGLSSTFGSVLVFYILVNDTLSGLITVGLFTFYLTTAGRFSGAVNRLLNNVISIYETGLYVADVFKALDLPLIINSGTVTLRGGVPPKIQFNNVTFKYPHTDKAVIENFNLTINPGDHIALVGENGAGKTTLIKLLMRFYDVTEGEILINDINIKELDLDNWYSLIGALFQDYNFYHFNARTNIGVGNIAKLENPNGVDGIIEAAKKAGAHEFIEEYENKYDQVLSKSFKGGINPSEGQRQKIALARTFFKNAPILIMDEPTSAIDPKAEYEIFQEIFTFAKEKTVLIISHRFSTVRNADRIIVLDHGKITEDGSHEELMQIENGKYKHAFELQKRGYT